MFGESGTITKRDVEELAIKTLDSNIFDLTDNLRKKEHKRSTTNIKWFTLFKGTNTKNINHFI